MAQAFRSLGCRLSTFSSGATAGPKKQIRAGQIWLQFQGSLGMFGRIAVTLGLEFRDGQVDHVCRILRRYTRDFSVNRNRLLGFSLQHEFSRPLRLLRQVRRLRADNGQGKKNEHGPHPCFPA
jgi:hypothetical protein